MTIGFNPITPSALNAGFSDPSFRYTATAAQNDGTYRLDLQQLVETTTANTNRIKRLAAQQATQFSERVVDTNRAALTNNQQAFNPLTNLQAAPVNALNAALGNLDKNPNENLLVDDALKSIQAYEAGLRQQNTRQQTVDQSLFDRSQTGNKPRVDAAQLNNAFLANNNINLNRVQQPEGLKTVSADLLKPQPQTDTSKLALQQLVNNSSLIASQNGLTPYVPANILNAQHRNLTSEGPASPQNQNDLNAQTNADGGGGQGFYMQLGAHSNGANQQGAGQQHPGQQPPLKQGLSLVA